LSCHWRFPLASILLRDWLTKTCTPNALCGQFTLIRNPSNEIVDWGDADMRGKPPIQIRNDQAFLAGAGIKKRALNEYIRQRLKKI
jgi:hypothetical protein